MQRQRLPPPPPLRLSSLVSSALLSVLYFSIHTLLHALKSDSKYLHLVLPRWRRQALPSRHRGLNSGSTSAFICIGLSKKRRTVSGLSQIPDRSGLGSGKYSHASLDLLLQADVAGILPKCINSCALFLRGLALDTNNTKCPDAHRRGLQ